MTDRKDLHRSRRKIRDRSIALLIAGSVALLPPFAGISLIDAKIAGVPTPLLYIFLVWAMLITGAALLARPLRDSDAAISASDVNDSVP